MFLYLTQVATLPDLTGFGITVQRKLGQFGPFSRIKAHLKTCQALFADSYTEISLKAELLHKLPVMPECLYRASIRG
ncbi:MAG: hypothetical protein KDI79_26585, partial [Anaerolineae bacterium]|nr:hypothetical protein [Anaerolineae bacterium]